jgi:hypothetical protein
MKARRPMLAQFVLFDGFDRLDIIPAFETVGATRMFGAEVAVELVSAEGPQQVQSGLPEAESAASSPDTAR